MIYLPKLTAPPPLVERVSSWEELYQLFDWYYDPTTSHLDRLAFQKNRVAYLRSCQRVKDFQLLTTSGTSGLAVSYKWGPDFVHFHDFHMKMTTFESSWPESLDQAKMLVLNINHVGSRSYFQVPEEGSFLVDHFNHGTAHRWITINFLDLDNLDQVISSLQEEIRSFNRFKLCVALPPNLVEILLRSNSHFFTKCFPASRTALFLTFEATSPWLKRKLQQLNYQSYDYMRCWDGGATFYTCHFRHTHWVDFLSHLSMDEKGQLLCTDLWNSAQSFQDYANGDYVQLAVTHQPCSCGRLKLEGHITGKKIRKVSIPESLEKFSYTRLLEVLAQAIQSASVESMLELIGPISFSSDLDCFNIHTLAPLDRSCLESFKSLLKIDQDVKVERDFSFNRGKLIKIFNRFKL